jgi:hypothetical protein
MAQLRNTLVHLFNSTRDSTRDIQNKQTSANSPEIVLEIVSRRRLPVQLRRPPGGSPHPARPSHRPASRAAAALLTARTSAQPRPCPLPTQVRISSTLHQMFVPVRSGGRPSSVPRSGREIRPLPRGWGRAGVERRAAGDSRCGGETGRRQVASRGRESGGGR